MKRVNALCGSVTLCDLLWDLHDRRSQRRNKLTLGVGGLAAVVFCSVVSWSLRRRALVVSSLGLRWLSIWPPGNKRRNTNDLPVCADHGVAVDLRAPHSDDVDRTF
jgi:hypothetical protein